MVGMVFDPHVCSRTFFTRLPKKTNLMIFSSWRILSMGALCNADADTEVQLTFSMCYPDMYSCDSGHCIPLRFKYRHFLLFTRELMCAFVFSK